MATHRRRPWESSGKERRWDVKRYLDTWLQTNLAFRDDVRVRHVEDVIIIRFDGEMPSLPPPEEGVERLGPVAVRVDGQLYIRAKEGENTAKALADLWHAIPEDVWEDEMVAAEHERKVARHIEFWLDEDGPIAARRRTSATGGGGT